MISQVPTPLKTVGLIGGMGWESSALYYNLLNQTVRQRIGGSASAPCILTSLDFSSLVPLVDRCNWTGLTDILVAAARNLEAIGVDLIAICSATAHIAAPDIEQGTAVPLVHIADAAAAALRHMSARRIGLLATRHTVEHGLFARRWHDRFDLVTLNPRPRARDGLNDLIYNRILAGDRSAEIGDELGEMVTDLGRRGADVVVLGCTDLAPYLTDRMLPVPTLDAARTHALAIANML